MYLMLQRESPHVGSRPANNQLTFGAARGRTRLSRLWLWFQCCFCHRGASYGQRLERSGGVFDRFSFCRLVGLEIQSGYIKQHAVIQNALWWFAIAAALSNRECGHNRGAWSPVRAVSSIDRVPVC